MKTEIFKSKNGLKIIVEDRNEMIGTMDWFNDLMAKSKFIICPKPDGEPALYLKTINREEEEEYRLLCTRRYQERDDVRETEDGYIYPYPYEVGDDYKYGLFTHPLTPAAEEEVENMLQKAVEAFKEWYEVEEGMVHIYPKGYSKK
jgi:hypothetical protein